MLNIAHQFAVDGDAFEYDSIDCQLQINFCLASLTRAIKVGPAVEVEEEPQKKEDKGI